ncbi:MAG: TonB-dependent receptor [Bacteroidales bacterium]|nr:TonB-dependent receptor [Bacteroidales bacterium]
MKKVSSASALVSLCLLALTGVTPILSVRAEAAPLQQPQQKGITVRGTVTDRQGEPIAGANVVIPGTQQGTMTDIDGRFSLEVPSLRTSLRVSFIGYMPQEVTPDARGTVKVVLEEDSELLDDVVVVGYGTMKTADITSAVASVKSEDFTNGKISDAAELIKGKVAGLSIVKSSGDPNATSSIMLRGITTIHGDVTPLVLVDGIEGSLSTVAPENIASIDVLKDASAAAIYGTRGANGVIIITTKTGHRDQKAEVTYNGYVSLSDWYKTADFMDTHDIIYGRTNFSFEGYDTDWLKAVTRKAGSMHNHSLSINGGGKNNTYSANVTFSNELGIMRRSDSNDLKMQLDVTQYFLNDIVKVNLNALYSRHKNTNNDNAYVYRQALIHNPSSPIYRSDGSYYEEFSRFQYYNPVEIQNERIGDYRSHNARITGNISVEPIKGWVTNLMLSMDEGHGEGEDWYDHQYYTLATGTTNGSAGKSSANDRSDNLEITTKYENTLGRHRINALAGYSYLYNVYDGFSAGNSNFPTSSYLYNSLGQGTFLTDEDHTASMSSYKNDNTLVGFFGRVSYGYDNRYNVMLSIRREGSSKFGANNKWGNFPSASFGWNIINESWMKGLTWLDNLKLRAGYGVTGVIPSSSYLSLTMYDYDTYGWHRNTDGTWAQSLKVSQNPNPNLKWEKTKEFNVGLDWAVLGNRLSGSVDVYTKKTVDLLYDYAVPVPPNMYSQTTANVGQMRNTGVEVLINATPVETKNFSWHTTLTLSHNTNKLLSLSNDLYETDNFQELWGGLSDPISLPTHCMEIDHTLGDFWGLKSVGVSKNGVVLVEVKDADGNWVAKEWDSSYNLESNRQRLGNGLPSIYMGWNNTFRYRDFDLSLQFTGQFGYQILNEQRAFYQNNSIAYNRLKSAADLHAAINPDGSPALDEDGKQIMVALSNSMAQGFWSDHLEDGDFVKLQSATLGYTYAPKNDTLRKYIKSARIYVSGQNLFCITGYSGLDPEVSNYFLTPGVDSRDKYPTVRSWTIGLNINF